MANLAAAQQSYEFEGHLRKVVEVPFDGTGARLAAVMDNTARRAAHFMRRPAPSTEHRGHWFGWSAAVALRLRAR
nr:hypothetical protein StreXyl84_64530 [Streptomyces sp. Xyl84]